MIPLFHKAHLEPWSELYRQIWSEQCLDGLVACVVREDEVLFSPWQPVTNCLTLVSEPSILLCPEGSDGLWCVTSNQYSLHSFFLGRNFTLTQHISESYLLFHEIQHFIYNRYFKFSRNKQNVFWAEMSGEYPAWLQTSAAALHHMNVRLTFAFGEICGMFDEIFPGHIHSRDVRRTFYLHTILSSENVRWRVWKRLPIDEMQTLPESNFFLRCRPNLSIVFTY